MENRTRLRLKAVFYAEFHNVTGCRILHQQPQSPEIQLPASKYIITKPKLCDKLLSFSHDGVFYMGIPQYMSGVGTYERNALLFNLVMMFDLPKDGGYDDLVGIFQDCYGPVLKKVVGQIRALEEEKGFLSDPQLRNHWMDKLLEKMLLGLNSKAGQFEIVIDSKHSVNGKIIYLPKMKIGEIPSYQVPVMRLSPEELNEFVLDDWDLTLQKIIPYIDGKNYVNKISFLANVDINLVKKVLQHLLYYGVIVMKDIFQYSNMYALTSKTVMKELFHSKKLQQECMDYVAKSYPVVQINDILELYCQFKPGLTFQDIISNSEISSGIHHEAFITFGVLRGILKRVHEYPIATVEDEHSPLASYLDGRHCLDEICVDFCLPRNKILELIDEYPNSVKLMF